MEEQLSFFVNKHPEEEEIDFIKSIIPKLEKIVSDYGASPENLIYYPIQGKTVVKYKPKYSDGRIIFYAHIRKKSRYIELHNSMLDIISTEIPIEKSLSTEVKYFRVNIDQTYPVQNYIDLLMAVTKATLDRWPKEWDCCSRVEKCSDQKACVHPDKEFSLKCGYRKILNSGRIFYGKNRNID